MSSFDSPASHFVTGRTTRRHWIASTIAGAGLAMATTQEARAEPVIARRRRFRIGCSGRSFHRELSSRGQPGTLSLVDFMRKCSSWDCDCIELLDVCFPKTDQAFLASIRREAFLQSIELSGVSVYTDFLKSSTARRDAELKKVRSWIDYTASLGASLLVVFPGPSQRDLSRDEAVRRVTESLLRLTQHARQQGVILGLENHGMFQPDAQSVLEVIEKVDDPWIKANLDTGNFLHNPYENMAALVPKAVNCHLKLEVHKDGQNVPADLKRKFCILRDGGYRGRVTLQYELSGDPFEEVPKYLATIQALANPM